MSNRTASASQAVREAWDREKELVKVGKGTRDWTPHQQISIIKFGKAYDKDGKAFEGHHMKSVEKYPEYQGDPGNIQFLSRKEHTDAHDGSFHNPTNGYYDPENGKTANFGSEPFSACEIINLSNPVFQSGENRQQTKAGDFGVKNAEKSIMKGDGKMSGWEVSEEAISAMKGMASRLEELAEQIHKETETLKSAFEDNKEGLGPHFSEIMALIEEVEGSETGAAIQVKKLSLKLQRAAIIRTGVLQSGRYRGKSR